MYSLFEFYADAAACEPKWLGWHPWIPFPSCCVPVSVPPRRYIRWAFPEWDWTGSEIWGMDNYFSWINICHGREKDERKVRGVSGVGKHGFVEGFSRGKMTWSRCDWISNFTLWYLLSYRDLCGWAWLEGVVWWFQCSSTISMKDSRLINNN